jgi:hypothetical protein
MREYDAIKKIVDNLTPDNLVICKSAVTMCFQFGDTSELPTAVAVSGLTPEELLYFF